MKLNFATPINATRTSITRCARAIKVSHVHISIRYNGHRES